MLTSISARILGQTSLDFSFSSAILRRLEVLAALTALRVLFCRARGGSDRDSSYSDSASCIEPSKEEQYPTSSDWVSDDTDEVFPRLWMTAGEQDTDLCFVAVMRSKIFCSRRICSLCARSSRKRFALALVTFTCWSELERCMVLDEFLLVQE